MKNDSHQVGFIPAIGLCSICKNSRIVPTKRSASFWLCEAASSETGLKRYPSLPCRKCDSFMSRSDVDGAEVENVD